MKTRGRRLPGGFSLSERLAQEKRDFIRVEMAAVPEPHLGLGRLRALLDIAFEMGRERGLPCILDTDGREKMERYRHLGMELADVRQVGERTWLYDLIWIPEEYECSNSG